MHHWHWLIVIYLFLGGLGAGAYLTSFAAEKGWLGSNSHLKRVGYLIAAPIVAIGTILLVFDLGQGLHKPWLLIRLLVNFSSVMTWGVYILSGFIIVGLVKGFLVLKNQSVPTVITWLGAFLAIATCAYTGLLVAVIRAVPIWNSYLMPLLFIISAISTGLSVTTILAHFIEKEGKANAREGQAHLHLIVAEVVIVAIFLGMMVSGLNGPVGTESAKLVMFGPYTFIFWGYFIILGLICPLGVFALENLKSKKLAKKVLTEPVLRETTATSESSHSSYLMLVTDYFVLVGGFALRALVIFAALPIWDGTIK
ncbi:MAG: oxidoreductase [Gracilibacter sp. BRH_c7a]|nr:MAG: oxidoreductase [Gracilibacter sp. BRH_c7a]